MKQRFKILYVGAKKLFGTIFHGSPEGVKHMEMLNNSFARDITICYLRRANEYAPTCKT